MRVRALQDCVYPNIVRQKGDVFEYEGLAMPFLETVEVIGSVIELAILETVEEIEIVEPLEVFAENTNKIKASRSRNVQSK